MPEAEEAAAPKLSKIEWFAAQMFKYFGSLLMERNDDGRYVMSIGRVALMAVLAQAMWQWRILDRDIVPGLKDTLFALLTYNFGTKGVNVARDMVDAWKARGTITSMAQGQPPAEAPAPVQP